MLGERPLGGFRLNEYSLRFFWTTGRGEELAIYPHVLQDYPLFVVDLQWRLHATDRRVHQPQVPYRGFRVRPTISKPTFNLRPHSVRLR